jgi:hypothetical protein
MLHFTPKERYNMPLQTKRMVQMRLFWVWVVVLLLALGSLELNAADESSHLDSVVEIARGIEAVQPRIKRAQAIRYGIGIYHASQKYRIHPAILISITKQESTFRENLPEGPAGEIGICQIIKAWLPNKGFQKEFGKVSVHWLKKPANSFKVAAWLLSRLRADFDRTGTSSLPYWSYYNSKNFENRLKYFLRVNKHLSALRTQAPNVYSDTVIEEILPSKSAAAIKRQIASPIIKKVSQNSTVQKLDQERI